MNNQFAEALAVVIGSKFPANRALTPGVSTYAEAFATYQAALRDAVQFHDPNWSQSAITRERSRRVQAARAELAQTLDAAALQDTGSADDAAKAAFEQIAATDANSVAVARNEWTKVRALLAAGRSLSQVIDNADRRRLSAILDHLDSDLAIESGDPDGVFAEVSQAVLARLAGLGDEKAIAAVAAQQATRHSAAWRSVIGEAVGGSVSLEARTALYQANIDEYRAAFDDDPATAEVEQAVTRLDTLGPEAQNGAADDRA